MKIKLQSGDVIELSPDNIESPEVQAALAAQGMKGYKNKDTGGYSIEEIVDFDAEREAGIDAKFTELQLRLNGGDANNLSKPPVMLTLREIHIKSAPPQQPSQSNSSADEFAANLRRAFASRPS